MSNGLSDYSVKKIMLCFGEDLTASRTARLLGLNRNTVNRYYNLLREAVLTAGRPKKPGSLGEFEPDESYFGGRRVRGKKGRGAAGKTPVFGLLKRDGKVLIEVVKNCSKGQLMPIIQSHVLEGSTVHTDGWKA